MTLTLALILKADINYTAKTHNELDPDAVSSLCYNFQEVMSPGGMCVRKWNTVEGEISL